MTMASQLRAPFWLSLAAAALAATVALDVTTTWIGLNTGHVEGNPVLANLIATHGLVQSMAMRGCFGVAVFAALGALVAQGSSRTMRVCAVPVLAIGGALTLLVGLHNAWLLS